MRIEQLFFSVKFFNALAFSMCESARFDPAPLSIIDPFNHIPSWTGAIFFQLRD